MSNRQLLIEIVLGIAVIGLLIMTACVPLQILPRCGPVENLARADCTDVEGNLHLAKQVFGPGAPDVPITIVAEPYLERKPYGNVVRGRTVCKRRTAVIILDRTMHGLLHELYHADDCVHGRDMVHDERHAGADRLRFLEPRR